MATVHHLNCGWLQTEAHPRVPCHCLLIEDRRGLALVDAGIGLHDCRNPEERIGRELIDFAGFQFGEEDAAVRQIERLGFRPADVSHIVLTHGDPDHAGGLTDFPAAQVHVAVEELTAIQGGDRRYRPPQFTPAPRWVTAGPSARRWFGLEARPLPMGFEGEILLVPLFGHTLGHSGVAIRQCGDRWLLHVGDAYYLRAELTIPDHPVSELAARNAADDAQRLKSLDAVRRLGREHADRVVMVNYHDLTEFPS